MTFKTAPQAEPIPSHGLGVWQTLMMDAVLASKVVTVGQISGMTPDQMVQFLCSIVAAACDGLDVDALIAAARQS